MFIAGNDFESEALEGALPVGQNNPKVRGGLDGCCAARTAPRGKLPLRVVGWQGMQEPHPNSAYSHHALLLIHAQKCPLGLYAEQLSGSAFTAPRKWVLGGPASGGDRGCHTHALQMCVQASWSPIS